MESGEKKHELEARLLCQPVALIGEILKLSPEAVIAYARTFFDVLDVEAQTSWLIFDAAGAVNWRWRPPTEPEIWNYFAIAAGPVILDLLIEDWRSPDPLADPHRHLLAERARFLARDLSAQMRGRIMDREMLAERRRLFADCDRAHKSDGLYTWRLKLLETVADQAPSQRPATDVHAIKPPRPIGDNAARERDHGDGITVSPLVERAPTVPAQSTTAAGPAPQEAVA
jgi:hypothetical protein